MATYYRQSIDHRYELNLKSGHYRIYLDGVEVWKSKGKTDSDRDIANSKFNAYVGGKIPNTYNYQEPKPDPVKVAQEEAAKKAQDAFENQKELTEEERARQQKLQDFLIASQALSKKTGQNWEEIVLDWAKNPENIPEDLREKYGSLDDQTFLSLSNASSGTNNLVDALKSIQHHQDERRKPLQGLYDEVSKREQDRRNELELATDPNVGVESTNSLWNDLTDEQRENTNLQQLDNLQLRKDLDQARNLGRGQSDFYNNLMPGNDFEVDWNERPTYEAAQNIWNEHYKPNYVYESAKPFDQREHELGMAGHAKGSGTLADNAVRRGNAMYSEDLDQIGKIQNMLETSHRSIGSTLGNIERVGDASRKSLMEPITQSTKTLGDELQRQDDQNFKQDVFKKDLAEGDINLQNQEMNEDLQSYNLLEQQRAQEGQEYKNLSNEIYNFGMLAENINQLSADKQQEYRVLEQQLWADRQRIIAMYRQLGMQEQAFELQQTQNDKEAFMKKLAFIAKIAGSVALGATGNIPAAAAIWAPSVASNLSGGNTFGTSAQAGANAPTGG